MTWFEIFLSILSIFITFFGYYLLVRSELQKNAGDAINFAEKTSLKGQEKMNVAVAQIYELVPIAFKPIFTTELIKKIVQEAFDKMQEFAKKQVNNGSGEV